jgi:hypothetical protein
LKPLYAVFFGLSSKMMKSGVTGHLPEKAIFLQILPLLNDKLCLYALFGFHACPKNMVAQYVRHTRIT